MPSFAIPSTRQVFLLAFLSASFCIPSASLIAQSQASDKTPATDQAPLQLKIESNLVVVRAVVRDAQGHPVEGLKKEDFKLFDRGREQPVSQFEDESPVAAPSTSTAASPQGQTAAPPAPAVQERYIALYFDDLNTSDADMMQARDAADSYLTARLRPNDRVAIFTTGRILTAFTADPARIHSALSELHSSSRLLTRVHECPDLSDYQAQEIARGSDGNSDVWKVAFAEAMNCKPPLDPRSAPTVILMHAEKIWGQAQQQASENLQQFAEVVKYVAQAPGQRAVILVSPGFLSQSEHLAIDRTIDCALRSQVVINSLNPRGLAVMLRESDASRSSIALANPRTSQARNVQDASREFAANDVLAEVAQGTGGEFLHDNNDLKAGFEALTGQHANYILSFVPRDMKLDGKYHELKLTLAEKHKGYSIHARRGYFAVADEPGAAVGPTKEESQSEPVVESANPKKASPISPREEKQPKASASEAQEQKQIQDALRSTTDSTDLPVELDASPSEGEGETRLLAVTMHLDTRLLSLRKNDGHNLNALTFAFAIFDEKDNEIQVNQRRTNVDLLDDRLPDFLRDGMDMNGMLEVKPGSYRLRVVVIESEGHRLGSVSRNVNVP